jgi:hypothetical protein
MDGIDALMGLVPTEEEELRAMADQLRGKKRAADFFAVSTVPGIGDISRQQQKDIQSQAASAGLWRSRDLDRQSMERRAKEGYGSRRDKYAEWFRDANGVPNLIGLKNGRQWNFTTGQPMGPDDMAGMVYKPFSEGGETAALMRFSEQARPLQDVVQRVIELETMLEPYAKEGVPVSEIPGLGFLEKMPVVGNVVRAVQDIVQPGTAQGDMHSAVVGLMAAIAKADVGLTQTKQEMKNITDSSGRSALDHPDVFAKAFPRIQRRLYEELRSIEAGASQVIPQYFNQRYQGQLNPFDYVPVEFSFPDSIGVSGLLGIGGEEEVLTPDEEIMSDLDRIHEQKILESDTEALIRRLEELPQ